MGIPAQKPTAFATAIVCRSRRVTKNPLLEKLLWVEVPL